MDSTNKEVYLSISASPHIRSDEDTRSIMTDVLLALMPALAVAAYMFGFRAIVSAVISTGACMFFEWTYRKLMKKSKSWDDLSAAVTGLLLAFCVPVTLPLWMLLIGDFFAIVVVKQLFGGIGKNFMNPALAARAFLFSWPTAMNHWVAPHSYASFFASCADAVTEATPLASLSQSALPSGTTLLQSFVGYVGGSMGEISTLAILLGGAYLLFRRIINLRIPLSYILTVAVLTFLFPRGNERLSWMVWQLFSGGLMLGAIFMATDYVTSPVNPLAQIIFGFGCGVLTVFIRYFGSYPEGVSYAILVMNSVVWLLDKACPRRRFGVQRKKRGTKEEKAL